MLKATDLRWFRRLVVAVTVVGLVAVACSGGGSSTQSADTTTTVASGTSTSGATTSTAPPKKIDTIPGMPPVVDPSNLYSEIASDKVSDVAKQALTRVYVPNLQSNTVSVIDPTKMQVVDTIQVGVNPQHVVPSWDLKTLWVTNNAEGRTDGTLTPIDPNTGQRRGPDVAVDDPYNMYFTPDGKSAIVVAEARKRLDFLDPQTMAHQVSVDVPECAGVNHGDFSIDGSFAIFTCEFQGSLVKVDTVNHKVLGYLTLSGGGMPQDIRVSPDGSTFYVAEMMRGGVYTIDPYSFTETGFIPTGIGTHGLYPSRDGTKLYVANRGQDHVGNNVPNGPGSVSVIDFATSKVVATWPVPGGGSPDMGNVSVDGKTLWLSGRYDNVVYAINTDTGEMQKIAVGKEPHGLAVWPQPGRYSLGHTGNMR
ncbi:MAG TPA: YncE family protein [Acidimicrobiia bacterium]